MQQRLNSKKRLIFALSLVCAAAGSADAAVPEWPSSLPDVSSLTTAQLGELVTGLDTGLATELLEDMTTLSVNTSIWLASHLPATMPQTGMGSGLNLSDGFGVAIGIIPMRMGVFNQFDKVAEGMQVLDLDGMLPATMVWPQFGVTAGIGLGFGIEVAADLQFIPDINVTLLDEVDVSVGLLSASASARWRINDPWGPVPAIVIGIGASYYTGKMRISASQGGGFTMPVPVTVAGISFDAQIEGTYSFEMAPEVTWNLYQVNPEVRLAWEIGPFQPYVGFGVGFCYGKVTGGATVTAKVDVTAVAGDLFNQTLESVDESYENLYTTSPAAYTFRPHIGFDIDLGLFAITAQLDVAVMTSAPVSADIATVESAFNDVNEETFYDAASKGSTTSAALVATVAARIQF